MDRNGGGRDRIVRALLTAVLTVAAVSALRDGKHKKGVLTGIGALRDADQSYNVNSSVSSAIRSATSAFTSASS